MIRLLFLFFSYSILLNSCKSSDEGNKYFSSIDNELTVDVRSNPKELKKLYSRELQKYNKTKDKIFLLSSEQIEIALTDNEEKKIVMLYKLMQLNDNKYEYISIMCNKSFAAYFEKSSPAIAVKYINHALEISEKTQEKYLLPHILHFKGRVLYNDKKYQVAINHFNRALDLHKEKKEILFVASMYNNLGMCYAKMKNIDLAIEKVIIGINILEEKKELNSDEYFFLNYMKRILADYFIEKKDYKKAEKLLREILNFSLKNNIFPMTILCVKRLSGIYKKDPLKTDERKKVINQLISIEYKLKKVLPKIDLNEVTFEYHNDINDVENIKKTSEKIINLYNSYKKIAKMKSDIKSDIIHSFIVKSVDRENEFQKKRNILLTFLILLLLLILLLTSVYLIKLKKRKEEMILIEKEISRSQKMVLEQDIQLQKEKIKNLHLNLNLKTETERAFLENLKKIKRSKDINVEDVLKDLQFKINNLLLIDKKNNDFIDQSFIENQIFMDKLSSKFPALTDQDLKLCVYFKLNLSAKEISLLENFTVGSVRVYKTRIKSKIGLSKDDNLNLYLIKT